MRQKNASLSILDDWQFELRVSLGGYMGVCEQEGIFFKINIKFHFETRKKGPSKRKGQFIVECISHASKTV